MPLQVKTGATFTFFVEFVNTNSYSKIESKIRDAVNDVSLANEFTRIFKDLNRQHRRESVGLMTIRPETLIIDRAESKLNNGTMMVQMKEFVTTRGGHKGKVTEHGKNEKKHYIANSASGFVDDGDSDNACGKTELGGEVSDMQYAAMVMTRSRSVDLDSLAPPSLVPEQSQHVESPSGGSKVSKEAFSIASGSVSPREQRNENDANDHDIDLLGLSMVHQTPPQITAAVSYSSNHAQEGANSENGEQYAE